MKKKVEAFRNGNIPLPCPGRIPTKASRLCSGCAGWTVSLHAMVLSFQKVQERLLERGVAYHRSKVMPPR